MNKQNISDTATNAPTHSTTQPAKPKKRSRFKRVSKGIFRYRRTGIYYGIYKRNGKTTWKNLRTNDLRLARRLLADLIEHAPNFDWKNTGFVTVQKLVDLYAGNPMNLAASTFKGRKQIARCFQKHLVVWVRN